MGGGDFVCVWCVVYFGVLFGVGWVGCDCCVICMGYWVVGGVICVDIGCVCVCIGFWVLVCGGDCVVDVGVVLVIGVG